jgi:hypothetical protein
MRSTILNRKGQMERRLEIRTVVLMMIVTCAPALAAILLIAVSSDPDLSELNRVPQPDGAPAVLTWPELSRDRPHALNAAVAVSAGARVVAVGYMMDYGPPVSAGEFVRSFVLLPEAGNLLHPAHTIGDQMIEAHLTHVDGIPFAPRKLIRVVGKLGLRRSERAAEHPLYVLEEADAQPIDRADIRKYLK